MNMDRTRLEQIDRGARADRRRRRAAGSRAWPSPTRTGAAATGWSTWMREAGLTVTVDQMGNIFGERAGAAALPPVMMGSHVDSVPTGGKYDGQLGVLCGLEVIRTLNDTRCRTRHPVTPGHLHQRGGRALSARDDRQRCHGRQDRPRGRLQHARQGRDPAGRRARADRLSRLRALRPAPVARLPRAPHRAGAVPRGGRALGRRRRRHRGHRVVAPDDPRRAGPRRARRRCGSATTRWWPPPRWSRASGGSRARSAATS